MKILVISGSPKGENSLTLQYVKYVSKHLPGCEFSIRHVGRDIKKIEADSGVFDALIAEAATADGILWTFPVYHMSVPSQLKRFIELVFERSPDAFKDKYATALTTSVHFYDHTAHNYVNAVSCDLGLRYLDGFSAEMDDLLKEDERGQLLTFFRHFLDAIEKRRPIEMRFPQVSRRMPEFVPVGLPAASEPGHKKIAVVTDVAASDVNLSRMIEAFGKFAGNVDLINLHEVKINGGCLGCIKCAYDNVCVYTDGYREAYDRIMSADAIVYAGTIRDRSLSARWKIFFDRSFFKGHCPPESLKQIGYIVSGPLGSLPDLRQELEARASVKNSNLAGFVTDESGDPVQITALLGELAERLQWGTVEGFQRPASFLGVGGHLLFRDLVYNMSGWFGADYRFYKKYQLLDYPQKDYKARLFNFCLRTLMRIPQVRREFYGMAVVGMASKHRKISGE